MRLNSCSTTSTSARPGVPVRAVAVTIATTLVLLGVAGPVPRATGQAIVVRPCGGEQCGENHNQVLVV